jgi:hypothetical protein
LPRRHSVIALRPAGPPDASATLTSRSSRLRGDQRLGFVYEVRDLSVLRPASLVEALSQVSEDGQVLLDGLGPAPQKIGVHAGAVLDAAEPLTA